MERRRGAKEVVREAVQYHVPLRDWPADDRPREKLLRLGAAGLSDAELIAILIGSGTRRATAVDVAKELLRRHESLHRLARLSDPELERTPGIGRARAMSLLAAFEIGRRIERPAAETRPVFSSPEDVSRYMIPRLRDLVKEVFLVLLLTSANRLIREVTISEGNLNSSVVHPREVFKAAFDGLAAAVILVHNHPSGTLEPSPEDAAVTRQIVEAGRIVGIPVHDHIIIAGSNFMSFAERGLLGGAAAM